MLFSIYESAGQNFHSHAHRRQDCVRERRHNLTHAVEIFRWCFRHALDFVRRCRELVEYGSDFMRVLQLRYPQARVLWMDAVQLARHDLYRGAPVGAVVSGLPLLTMSPRKGGLSPRSVENYALTWRDRSAGTIGRIVHNGPLEPTMRKAG